MNIFTRFRKVIPVEVFGSVIILKIQEIFKKINKQKIAIISRILLKKITVGNYIFRTALRHVTYGKRKTTHTAKQLRNLNIT